MENESAEVPYAEAVSPQPISTQPVSTDNGGPAWEAEPQGFPLVSLFILVALCGVLMGMVVPLGEQIENGQLGPDQLIVSAFLGAVVLSVVGMIVSLFVHRRLSGVFLGGAVGAMLGLLAGPICLIPREGFSHLMVISVGGAIALLAIGAAARLTSKRRSVSLTPSDAAAPDERADRVRDSE